MWLGNGHLRQWWLNIAPDPECLFKQTIRRTRGNGHLRQRWFNIAPDPECPTPL